VLAVFNAGWFLTIGCAAMCAFSPCPQQHQQAAENICHHKSQIPARQSENQNHSSCPNHGYPMANLVAHGAPVITSGLPGGAHWAAVTVFISSSVPQVVRFSDKLSHSPPGFSTGRTLCRNISLLRV